MEEIINKMVEEITIKIKHDLDNYPYQGHDYLLVLLNAYNAWQEDERDGVDYIFNITNKDDVKCCLDGGMEMSEVVSIYNKWKNGTTPYFMFGRNHKDAEIFYNPSNFVHQLISSVEDFLPYVITYPYANEAYQKMYSLYITNWIEDVVLS